MTAVTVTMMVATMMVLTFGGGHDGNNDYGDGDDGVMINV